MTRLRNDFLSFSGISFEVYYSWIISSTTYESNENKTCNNECIENFNCWLLFKIRDFRLSNTTPSVKFNLQIPVLPRLFRNPTFTDERDDDDRHLLTDVIWHRNHINYLKIINTIIIQLSPTRSATLQSCRRVWRPLQNSNQIT